LIPSETLKPTRWFGWFRLFCRPNCASRRSDEPKHLLSYGVLLLANHFLCSSDFSFAQRTVFDPYATMESHVRKTASGIALKLLRSHARRIGNGGTKNHLLPPFNMNASSSLRRNRQVRRHFLSASLRGWAGTWPSRANFRRS